MILDPSDKYLEEKKRALEILHLVIDPELSVNIVDLGLVYNLDFSNEGKIGVIMTLSTPHCPMGESIVNAVDSVLSETFGGSEVLVDLVWDPAWTPEMITDEGKRQLGIEL